MKTCKLAPRERGREGEENWRGSGKCGEEIEGGREMRDKGRDGERGKAEGK